MVAAAGAIFSGTVTRVARGAEKRRPLPGLAERDPANQSPPEVETVAITFHIDQSIRGASPGADLTISQWMGAWSAGQRYRVGERALLFLYPPSKLGLTSCVLGPIGRFTLDSTGRVMISPQQLPAFHADPVLGGKSRVRFSDFARAVRRAAAEGYAP